MAEKAAKDFKYVVRIADTDLEGNKPVAYALTQIKGIGTRVASSIARVAGIPKDKKIGKLKDEEIEKLRSVLETIQMEIPGWLMNRRRDLETGENKHLIGGDLMLSVKEDINLMKMIKCYKGLRHEWGQKVRGQRTKSTGRRGLVVGVERKRVKR